MHAAQTTKVVGAGVVWIKCCKEVCNAVNGPLATVSCPQTMLSIPKPNPTLTLSSQQYRAYILFEKRLQQATFRGGGGGAMAPLLWFMIDII